MRPGTWCMVIAFGSAWAAGAWSAWWLIVGLVAVAVDFFLIQDGEWCYEIQRWRYDRKRHAEGRTDA